MVKAKLLKLKMNKAPGVDLVGTRILTELAEEISDTTAELFNKSLHFYTGVIRPVLYWNMRPQFGITCSRKHK